MRSLQLTKSHPAPNGAAETRMSSASSVCSAASSLPPSALRKGKYDTSCGRSVNSTPGPSIDLSIIHATYGKDASLYNILRIKPSADNNVIRRAYLLQGRKTLLDHGMARKTGSGACEFVTPDSVPKKLEDVPAEARRKFQAISIAYEILSTPDLKRAYDANKLSKKLPVELRRVTSGNSVRWKPFVEEKIIEDQHPDEHSHRRRASDDGWLHSHLQKLDQEAEMFLNGDFLDELDESIASMSESLSESIGSFIKRGIVSSNNVGSQEHAASKNAGAPRTASQTTHPCSLKDRALQKSCLRNNGKFPTVQTQFSEEIKNIPPVKQKVAIGSPCSVMGVHEFVSEIVDEAASMLAESFSGLLDRPAEKKIENGKLNNPPAPSIEEIRAWERNKLDEQLREGFGEPFYCPSPKRCSSSLKR